MDSRRQHPILSTTDMFFGLHGPVTPLHVCCVHSNPWSSRTHLNTLEHQWMRVWNGWPWGHRCVPETGGLAICAWMCMPLWPRPVWVWVSSWCCVGLCLCLCISACLYRFQYVSSVCLSPHGLCDVFLCLWASFSFVSVCVYLCMSVSVSTSGRVSIWAFPQALLGVCVHVALCLFLHVTWGMIVCVMVCLRVCICVCDCVWDCLNCICVCETVCACHWTVLSVWLCFTSGTIVGTKFFSNQENYFSVIFFKNHNEGKKSMMRKV